MLEDVDSYIYIGTSERGIRWMVLSVFSGTGPSRWPCLSLYLRWLESLDTIFFSDCVLLLHERIEIKTTASVEIFCESDSNVAMS